MGTKKQPPLYFMGIGGIGMNSVAGLAKDKGFDVCGSDQNIFPPASTKLEEMQIPVHTPYSEDNILRNKDRLFIVGNNISRTHVEASLVLKLGSKMMSFPSFLEEYFLNKTQNIVVCGTHGKTTTTTLLSYLLENLGAEPSYMIGGIPRNLPHPFKNGKGKLFVLEGDEYDTSFFDKGSKFLHYRPSFIILNNLEYDHVDIFKNYKALKSSFHALLDKVGKPENVVANLKDPGVRELLAERDWLNKVSPSSEANTHEALVKLSSPSHFDPKTQLWKRNFESTLWGQIPTESILPGDYNASNITQVLSTLTVLTRQEAIEKANIQKLQELLRNFKGVKKRGEYLGKAHSIDIFTDFAHHPTSVENVLRAMKESHKNRRILAAFEPKNASSRRNIFQERFAEALKLADRVFIAPPPFDARLKEEEKLDTTELCHLIGSNASPFESFENLESSLKKELQPNDVLIFLTCADFNGIPRSLLKDLNSL